MSPHPIDHPLAIAYLLLARDYVLAKDSNPDGQYAILRKRHEAGETWRAAGCPLYQDPDTTGDDDAR